MAMELRQFYLERNKEMRARSRRKVLQKFSPYLSEEVVWELDKKWLVKIPCFALIADRANGEELRFFVKMALAFEVSVFVPKDRPPARRLYVISQGVALYKGEQLGYGETWGSQDVFLKDKPNRARLRAFAMTYLHVQWLSCEVLDGLREEFPRAYRLARFWTLMHAVGEWLIMNYRRQSVVPIRLETADVERRINARQLSVVKTGSVNGAGEETFGLVSRYLQTSGYEIVKAPAGSTGLYIVRDCSVPPGKDLPRPPEGGGAAGTRSGAAGASGGGSGRGNSGVSARAGAESWLTSTTAFLSGRDKGDVSLHA